MRSVKVPEALNDLYRDMRDRRLLVPAIALVVAVLAIPILLKSDPPAAVPPPPIDASAGEPTAAEAAVLAEQTGIRDYRRRLAELKQRNPFESTFKAPKPEGDSGDGSGGTVPAGGAPETSPGVPTTTPPGGGDTPTTAPPPSETPAGGAPGSEPDAPTTQPVDDPDPEVRFFAGRADVVIGPIGKGRTLEGVRPLELLPSDDAPVAVFVGLAPRGEGAVFNLSPDVLDSHGEGSCAPHKPNPCRFLTLKPGESHYLKYGLKGTKTYRLKLVDAYVVRVPDPRGD